jgi:hypothetical protein
MMARPRRRTETVPALDLEALIDNLGLFQALVEVTRRAVEAKTGTTEFAEMSDRYCLSARLSKEYLVSLGAFTAGVPEWATDSNHPYHRADTVYVELGDALAARDGLLALDRAEAPRDEIVHRFALRLAESITAASYYN